VIDGTERGVAWYDSTSGRIMDLPVQCSLALHCVRTTASNGAEKASSSGKSTHRPLMPNVSSINSYQTMESYIKIKLHSQFFVIAGLSIGLLATLFGLHMSSEIESTPALMGLVSALWVGVSASIIGGRIKKYSVS